MFKKFDAASDIASSHPLKTSHQRNIRKDMTKHTMPTLEPYMDEIIPKKTQATLYKCRVSGTLLGIEGKILFFSYDDGQQTCYLPILRLLHQYPIALPHVQMDKGGISHILKGADVMAPGLTSTGGSLPDNLKKGDFVAIMAEGKEHALAIGKMTMSSDEIRAINKGPAIENLHFLGDGLFKLGDSIVS